MGMSLRSLRARPDEILGFAELERFARLKLKHFSSGMASRLAYAIAFYGGYRKSLSSTKSSRSAMRVSRRSARRVIAS
jgi:hypothetical protein